jgi:hypothetical protein
MTKPIYLFYLILNRKSKTYPPSFHNGRFRYQFLRHLKSHAQINRRRSEFLAVATVLAQCHHVEKPNRSLAEKPTRVHDTLPVGLSNGADRRKTIPGRSLVNPLLTAPSLISLNGNAGILFGYGKLSEFH